MKAAVLQLPSIGMSTTKLYHFIRIAHKRDVKLLLLGEYLLNSFFKELEHTSLRMIKEQSRRHIDVLKEMAQTHDMTIVTPIVLVKKGEPYKAIVKIAPHSIAYYYQQILINYSHWNEERFFANPIEPLKAPMVFTYEGVKFAVMGGFELHFDELWADVSAKNVDCVLLPTVSTFESHQRWRNLISSRAFTHNCYILRANRIGEFQEKEGTWRFYGDSLLATPNGDVVTTLGDTEELMIVDIDHAEVVAERRGWGFKEALNKRRD
jgi:predicted amidohydrolase